MKAIRLPNYLLIIVLALVSFGIYANSLNGDFLVDDVPGILRNPRIHDIGVYFSDYFKIRIGVLHELMQVFIWQIAGPNPFYYHFFNVLAHVACVILAFILCNLLFKNSTLSFLSSLIFAVHPIHTEAVSWISGGPYAFSSIFFIASLIFYIKSKKTMFYLLLSVIFALLCFLAGNSFAMLPIVFILYGLFFKEKTAEPKSLSRVRVITVFLILAISLICVGTFFVNKNKFMHLIFYFRGFSYLIVAAKAFVYYLKILYLPIQRGLYHPFAFNITNVGQVSPAFVFASIIILTAIIAFFKCRKNSKPVSFGIAWFFITYLPYSNIIPVCNIVSERYLYLPSVGFSILIAALFLKVWEIINRQDLYKRFLRIVGLSIITLFLGSYTLLTIKQNYEYNNIITYWESNINNFDEGYMFYNNLAGTYYAMGNLENAVIFSRINLMINPYQPHVWYNLGKVYREVGDLKQARECFENILKIDNNYYPAYKALEEIEDQE